MFAVIAMLLALQLIAGHRMIWLPQRWRTLDLGGPAKERFIARLMQTIRWLER